MRASVCSSCLREAHRALPTERLVAAPASRGLVVLRRLELGAQLARLRDAPRRRRPRDPCRARSRGGRRRARPRSHALPCAASSSVGLIVVFCSAAIGGCARRSTYLRSATAIACVDVDRGVDLARAVVELVVAAAASRAMRSPYACSGFASAAYCAVRAPCARGARRRRALIVRARCADRDQVVLDRGDPQPARRERRIQRQL